MDTAQGMGVACVAVYSDADANSRHVNMADQAIHIGGSAPSQSYLLGDVIIQAALETGAQAIHPGYGFLSENPDFVDKVLDAGLVFIGPSAFSIRAMGLKDAAKTLMEKSGVPVVPGYHGDNQDDKFLLSEARSIGFPVLIKAVAGGGGKGMRIVEKPGGFDAALASARAEADAAFGNSAVLIEKLVEKPRHIEVQVFGDGQDVVHLFERDCSLQRRHQKVIEEAPAPGMTQKMRAAMVAAAVKAAKAINYKGAGTIEFIVDGSRGLRPDGFWFMEMNTRLQVEHPVTEAVTGVDLVEWQLRVAAGEALPKTQQELQINGHAFEARIYAEDPENEFLPMSGKLSHLRFSTDARVDTGVLEGDVISPFYDPMIAKISAKGTTRKIALSKLAAGLEATEIAGAITNLTFLGNLARNPEFAQGNVDTGLIARNLGDLTCPEPPPARVVALAMVAVSGGENSHDWSTGFSLWEPLGWTVNICWRDQDYSGVLQFSGANSVQVLLGDCRIDVVYQDSSWTIVDGELKLRVKAIGQGVSVFGASNWNFTIPDPLISETDASSKENVIRAPMPGLVRTVLAKPGAGVKAGDQLVLMEAMKMEHALCAPRDCLVDQVFVTSDEQVEYDAPLVSLRDHEGHSSND